ncbi:PPAP phosphatase, partial [Probosciger aterrimus]|nr:PPAP phosphatase [Probosciger aterrimus]
ATIRMRARQLVCGIWSLCFMFCLFCIFLHQTTAKRKLKFVSVVFRHGDHTPQEFFPTDKHKEAGRQQGYGQLTKLGIQQQYELGQYLRRRYSYFLSVVYKQCEASTIYVQSTDCDYTLMSAQASLAGLYPPTQDQIWNPGILWQPIPVHTVPLSHDRLLYLPFSHCPKYNELLRETFATRDFQRQLKQYRVKYFQFWKSNSIVPLLSTLSNSMCSFQIFNLHRKSLCFLSSLQDINNYTLPVWATHGVRTKLTKLSELLVQAEFGFHKQIQKSRLQGGILLKAILKHISDARKPSHQQKMVMYSAHAATIAALQMALNVFNGKLPPYSACHFFELYQEKNGQQYTIEIYYRNNTQRDPHPLTLPGCKFRCPLERFTHLVSPVLVHYWTREC